MKRVVSIILLIILVVSLGINIKTINNKNHNREIMINHIYHGIIDVTRHIDSFIEASNKNEIYNAQIQLEYVAIKLIEVDNLVKYGRIYIDDRLYYPGILSFRFIGEGLIFGKNINGKNINGILDDNIVSASEIEYINKLNLDLKSIINEMTLKEPYTPNEKLTIKELNLILDSFYDTWSNTYESPYKLIWE